MMNETVMLSGLARQLVDAQLLAEAAAQQAVVKAKPAAAKGKYVRSATICSTMGPGVHLDVTPYNLKAV